jgi:hypothetical protein
MFEKACMSTKAFSSIRQYEILSGLTSQPIIMIALAFLRLQERAIAKSGIMMDPAKQPPYFARKDPIDSQSTKAWGRGSVVYANIDSSTGAISVISLLTRNMALPLGLFLTSRASTKTSERQTASIARHADP